MLRSARFAMMMVAMMLSAATAAAQSEPAAPRFSFAEQVIISRNDALDALVAVDPQGVRKLLDALAIAKQQPAEAKSAPTPGKHRDIGPLLPEGFVLPDRERNPDLNLLFQRSSPEAAYDLFQILKRVGRAVAN
jgi:hypothetical protein